MKWQRIGIHLNLPEECSWGCEPLLSLVIWLRPLLLEQDRRGHLGSWLGFGDKDSWEPVSKIFGLRLEAWSFADYSNPQVSKGDLIKDSRTAPDFSVSISHFLRKLWYHGELALIIAESTKIIQQHRGETQLIHLWNHGSISGLLCLWTVYHDRGKSRVTISYVPALIDHSSNNKMLIQSQ